MQTEQSRLLEDIVSSCRVWYSGGNDTEKKYGVMVGSYYLEARIGGDDQGLYLNGSYVKKDLANKVLNTLGQALDSDVLDLGQKAVTRDLLTGFGYEIMLDDYSMKELSKTERKELKEIFKVYDGTLTKRQTKLLKKYGLQVESQTDGNGHKIIINPETGLSIRAASTPSSWRSGRELAASLITFINYLYAQKSAIPAA